MIVVRVPGLGLSGRVSVQAVWVTGALLVPTFGVFVWSLAVGDFPVPLSDVLGALVGQGVEETEYIIRNLRLPRGLTAVLVGAAFGLSGAILQRLARNPLASPDTLGINAGAAAAALLVLVVWNGTSHQVTTGALAGSAAAMLAIYLLAYKRGVTGYRFVLVGIGITAVLQAFVQYLLTRAEVYQARQAVVWLTGSLNGRSWDEVRPVTYALAVLLPLALVLSRQLRMLELGDDAARGLGVPVERVRVSLLAIAVSLAAIGTASAGPIGFVALVSPQIARRLTGARSLGLLPAAACGALLLVASDLVARRLFAPTELPVGVITAILGAPYLLYLLARANRIGSIG